MPNVTRLLASLLLTALAATGLGAQTAKTWVGTVWGDFGTGSNWGGTAPTSNTSTHYALFTSGNANQVALSANRSIAGLEFSATAPGAGVSYSAPAVLTLGAFGIRNHSTTMVNMDVALALGAASTFTNNGDLWITSNLALGANSLTLAGTSTYYARLAGLISGTGGLTLNHTGAGGGWVLGSSNTYSGNTTLTAGSVITGSGGFGTGTLIFNGGTLSANSAVSYNNAVSVANTANFATSSFSPITLNGTVTMTASRTINVTGDGRVTLGAALGQSAAGYALTKAGTGALVLNAASTYTGGTTVTGGTLALGTSGTLSNANLLLNGGVLAASSTFSRSIGTGAGQVRFGASGGGFAAYGGALNVASFGADQDWYTLLGGQYLYLGSNVADNVVTWNTDLKLTSTTDFFLNVADNTSSTADKAVFAAVLSGTGNLVKEGAGRLELTQGGGARTGWTYILGGTLRAGQTDVLGTGGITLQNSTLELVSDSAHDYGNNLSVNSGNSTIVLDRQTAGAAQVLQFGILNGSGTLTVQKGANVTSGTATLRFDSANTATNLNVAAGARLEIGAYGGASATTVTGAGETVFTDAYANGISGLSKTGPGSLTLMATSNRTGATTLSSGSLWVGAYNALGTGTLTIGGVSTLGAVGGARSIANAVTLNISSTVGGENGLTFNGKVTNNSNNTLTVTNTGVTTFAGGLDLSANSTNRTFTLNNAGQVVVSSAIANGGTSTAGNLVKNGLGTLTLAGANTFTGNTTINAGTLNLTGSLAHSALTTIASGATLTGAGSVGDLTLHGTYAPGASPALVVIGDLLATSTALLQLEIGGEVRGAEYDALDLGTLTAGGTLEVAFVNGYAPAGAATFRLFNFSSATGSFAAVNLPTLAAGLSWNTDSLYTTGELGISAIPEPSTYAALVGVAALGLAVWRRRRAGSR